MTLGNVGRASSSDFVGKRKLLLVPYVVATRDAAELHELVSSYWEEAMGQVRKLELSFGPVRHLFHEGSIGQGEEAAGALEQGNPVGYPHLKQILDRGAALEPTEDIQALAETLDLHRCMAVVQSSQSVLHRLMNWFEESRKRRFTAIAASIERSLQADAVGLLVISPDHQVQFPNDVEVVYVVPPALDRINRWMREHRMDEGSAGEGEAAQGES